MALKLVPKIIKPLHSNEIRNNYKCQSVLNSDQFQGKDESLAVETLNISWTKPSTIVSFTCLSDAFGSSSNNLATVATLFFLI